jgi:uridylate kinase
LVIGGGGTARSYQSAAKAATGLSNDNLDWVGIYTTQLNAQFVRMLFGGDAYKEIITNPTKKFTTNKSIIIGAGWKPGCSTDNDAVLLAKTFGAKEIINLSNIDYVYTADPKVDLKATKLETVTWKELRNIIGDKWVPGANVPFDPTAAKTAQKLKLKVSFVKGTDLSEVEKVIQGKACQGTVIQ